MTIYKPSELRVFLSSIGASPKKGLSQNFLIDGNIVRKILMASGVEAGDLVLEIGPGPGSLTQALLEMGSCVTAVEKDETLATALNRFQTLPPRLEVVCQDIMQFPLEETFAGKGLIKVIANLPYHLTTPIIAELITKTDLFSSLTLMVQEEVARRFVAAPGTKDYSSFSVFLNYYSKPTYAFSVSRNCFYPVPKVDSAIVKLDLKPPPALPNPKDFFKLTRTAFKQRRKMLRVSLKPLYESEKVTAALLEMGKDPQARPETLSLDDFLHFYKILES